MIATINVTDEGAEGPIMQAGDEAGGAGLFLVKGRPTFVYNPTGRATERVVLVTDEPLAPGDHSITISVIPDPATGHQAVRLVTLVDGKEGAGANVRPFYGIRGEGVVGRSGVRALDANFPLPSDQGLQVRLIGLHRH
jgi:arylsulfatase